MAKAKKAKKKVRKAKKVASKVASSRTSASVRAAAAAAPASGPVTLDEARALAFAKRPQLAAPAAAAAVAPSASPAAMGAEREKLEKERRADRERRLREYKATMDIMKERGARRPAPASRATDTTGADTAGPAATIARFEPLQIVAEGDSWFKYDYPAFGGGIIDRLQRRVGVPIANMAKAGDEVRFMLGVIERKELIARLTSGSPSGGAWDALLFSGGGNDVVDNPMALWVKDFDPSVPPADLVHQTRFSAALELVRAGYEDLIHLRDTLSPATHLVFHGYDFAIPDGRGVCNLGPWLKPTFDLRNFPVDPLGARHQAVKTMLMRFSAMLTTLAGPNVTVINTQGTLEPRTSSWHNELHPAKAGFEKIADIFYQKLKALFPAQVV